MGGEGIDGPTAALFKALDAPVSEGGSSLSEGEKQLISLARALLRRSPIVVVDEATANVDYTTDQHIQQMLKEHERFASATVLSIAHRLTTILDSDKLLVLNGGKVVGFAAPSELLGLTPDECKLGETSKVKNAFRSLLRRQPDS